MGGGLGAGLEGFWLDPFVIIIIGFALDSTGVGVFVFGGAGFAEIFESEVLTGTGEWGFGSGFVSTGVGVFVLLVGGTGFTAAFSSVIKVGVSLLGAVGVLDSVCVLFYIDFLDSFHTTIHLSQEAVQILWFPSTSKQIIAEIASVCW